MHASLDGRIAVVTGAASGIGRSCAEVLVDGQRQLHRRMSALDRTGILVSAHSPVTQ